jgi:hypothetical protein
MNGTHKTDQRRNKMNFSTMTRLSFILAALALAFLMPATCHAQAEINPDTYAMDNTTSTTNMTTAQVALVPQPASATLTQHEAPAASLVRLNASAQFDHSAGLDAVRRMHANTLAYLRHVSEFVAHFGEASALAEIS